MHLPAKQLNMSFKKGISMLVSSSGVKHGPRETVSVAVHHLGLRTCQSEIYCISLQRPAGVYSNRYNLERTSKCSCS